MRCATRLIFSASPTDEPPYFCTTSAIGDLSITPGPHHVGTGPQSTKPGAVEDSARVAPGCASRFCHDRAPRVQRWLPSRADQRDDVGGRARGPRGERCGGELLRDLLLPSGLAGHDYLR